MSDNSFRLLHFIFYENNIIIIEKYFELEAANTEKCNKKNI